MLRASLGAEGEAAAPCLDEAPCGVVVFPGRQPPASGDSLPGTEWSAGRSGLGGAAP